MQTRRRYGKVAAVGLEEGGEWLIVIVQFAKAQTSRPTSLASFTPVLTLSAILFVVFCGLSETGSVIATGWRDYAGISTNERRGLGEEGRVME